MALNLWVTGGKPSNYNPLPTGWGNAYNLPNIGNYQITFTAYSPSSNPISVGVGSGGNPSGQTQFLLKPTPRTITFNFYSMNWVNLHDDNSSGDIVVKNISVVQAPLNQLTINGVDGFLSGSWSGSGTNVPTNIKFIDDSTVSVVATGTDSALVYKLYNLPVGQTYTFSADLSYLGTRIEVYHFTTTSGWTSIGPSYQDQSSPITFTVPNGAVRTELRLTNRNSPAGTYIYKKPMLTLGSTPAPYSKKTGNTMVLPTAKKNIYNVYGFTFVNATMQSGDGSLGGTIYTRLSTSTYIPVQPNTSYTISSNNILNFQIFYWNSPSSYLSATAWLGNPTTFTTPSNCYFIRINHNKTDGSNIYVSDVQTVQLEKGDKATPWQPYSVQVNKVPQRYVSAKNLLRNINDTVYNTLATGNGSYTINSDYNLTVNGTNWNAGFNAKTDPLSAGKNYTLNVSTTGSLAMDIYNPDNSFLLQNVSLTSGSGNGLYTFTPTQNGSHIIRFKNGNQVENYTISNWQLESGSSPTAFVPYTPVLPPVNTGMKFNGNNDSITFTDAPDIRLNHFSIESLVYFNSAKNYEVILQKGEGGSSTKFNYALWLYGTGALTFMMGDGTTGYQVSGTIPLNQWVNVTATYDGTAMRIYFNGVLQNTVNVSVTPYKGSENMYVGKYGSGLNASPDGNIKFINLYSRALSASEVVSRYNGGPIPTGIVRNYDFTNPNTIVGNTIFSTVPQNLLPSFEDPRWNINPDYKIVGKDYLYLNATGSYRGLTINQKLLPALPNQKYLIGAYADKWGVGTNIYVEPQYYDVNGTKLGQGDFINSQIITTPANTVNFGLFIGNGSNTGSFTVWQPFIYQLSGQEGTINGSPAPLMKPSKRTLYNKR